MTTIGNITFGQSSEPRLGWQCPRCRHCWSPDIRECGECNGPMVDTHHNLLATPPLGFAEYTKPYRTPSALEDTRLIAGTWFVSQI